MAATRKGKPILSGQNLAFGVIFLDGIGLGALLPLLPFLVLSFDQSPAVVTLLTAVYALTGLVGNLLIGSVSDRLGRVKTIKLTLVGSLIADLGMLLIWSLPALFIFRALSGLMTGRESVFQALVTDDAPEEDHAKLVGGLAGAYILGIAFGPALTSLLGMVVDDELRLFRLIFLIALVATAAALCLTHILWPSSQIHDQGKNGEVSSSISEVMGVLRPLMEPLVLGFAAAYAFSVIMSVSPLLGGDRYQWTTVEFGWLLSGVTVAVVLARVVLAPYLAKRWGLRKPMIGVLITTIVFLVYNGIGSTVASFLVSVLLVSVATAMASVFSTTSVSETANSHNRGLAFGVYQATYSGAIFLGGLVNGFLFQELGPSSPYIVAALLVAASLPFALVGRRREITNLARSYEHEQGTNRDG